MDRHTEQLEELNSIGAKVYPSDEALLAEMGSTLDLVCLPVGIAYHKPMTCKFLAAGVNVMLEKPAAGCIADVEAMIEAERRSTGFVSVGFQHMYGRDIQVIKKHILSGMFGRLKNISVMGAWKRDDRYYARNNWAGKLYAPDGSAVFDSPINNAFAHYLNIALFCAGSSFETTAKVEAMQSEMICTRNIESFDVCGLRAITGDKKSIHVLNTHACREDIEPYLRFDLEAGQIHWDSGANKWCILNSCGDLLLESEMPDCRQSMFEDVIARLGDPDVFTYSLSNALEHTYCIEHMHQMFSVKKLRDNESDILYNGDISRMLPDINEIFKVAFNKNQLPYELGATWGARTVMKPVQNQLLAEMAV